VIFFPEKNSKNYPDCWGRCNSTLKYSIKKIFVDKIATDDKLTKNILEYYQDAEIVFLPKNKSIHDIASDGNPKHSLYLTHGKAGVIKGCPGTSTDYLCCKYQVINHTQNCPLNCSYCILQFYLNQPATVIYTDVNNILRDLKSKLALQPKRLFRIGTGELGDSLALFGSRLFAKEIIEIIDQMPNVIFEIKSKVVDIDDLLHLKNKKRIVFSWSLNPQKVVDKEESMASTVDERLKAARKAQKAGFLTGFHFDPMLIFPGWEKAYPSLADKLYSYINPSGIAWISMGSLRYPPSMKEKIILQYPDTKIPYGEMIIGNDGKSRYARPVRIPLYKSLYEKLFAVPNPPFIYFCMESALVWNEVMGFAPASNDDLDFRFTKSISTRFKNLISFSPELKNYLDALNLDGNEFQSG